ncbi:MAG: hypothetical protein H7Y04_12670 [Verrucomicrobia bacterium]|nr:hypothetical protein [Cytophagales bacterium]
MKKALLSLVGILWFTFAFGQNFDRPKNQFLGISMSRSKHGTGDIAGISFNTEYSRNIRKRISMIVTFGGTLHDGSKSLIYSSPSGETIDGSIRYTTGGIQTSFGIGYDFIQTLHHAFQVRLSPLLRYQSTSYYDVLTILFPPITGLPIPVVYFENLTPARTFAIGAMGHTSYNFTPKNRNIFRLFGEFQLDSNGDVISGLGVSWGMKF